MRGKLSGRLGKNRRRQRSPRANSIQLRWNPAEIFQDFPCRRSLQYNAASDVGLFRVTRFPKGWLQLILSAKGRILGQRDESTSVAEPVVETVKRKRTRQQNKPKRQPRYHVILWDDDDHSYEYVIEMMRALFSHQVERGFEIAVEVDTKGRAVCLTTTKEHAELKRDQIHAYGKDRLIRNCVGSMSASIEPEE
jgi:ATP-dependent Clp protease adaptor protein ClpS